MKKAIAALIFLSAAHGYAMEDGTVCFGPKLDTNQFRLHRMIIVLEGEKIGYKIFNPLAEKATDCNDLEKKLEEAVDQRLDKNPLLKVD